MSVGFFDILRRNLGWKSATGPTVIASVTIDRSAGLRSTTGKSAGLRTTTGSASLRATTGLTRGLQE